MRAKILPTLFSGLRFLISVQLDWPSIADWAYASIFAVKVQFHIRDQFWIPQPKLHGACILDFVEKSKNELVWPFFMFLAILVKI